LGISPKRFGGWEPTETTRYFYDRRGRVIRTETTREAEWDSEQQALMLALAEGRLLFCPDCGGDRDETMDPKNEFAYKAIGPWLCWGCQAIGRAYDKYVESHPKVTNPNRWTLEKR
jgi:hypothetical protein